MKAKQAGFTLIELMIVVAVVGILTVIALPTYQNYAARAQLAEALSLADGQKNALITYFSEHGSFPSNNAQAMIADDIEGKYVASVKVDNTTTNAQSNTRVGKIVATLKSGNAGSDVAVDLRGAKLTLQASSNTDSGALTWVCTAAASDNSPLDDKYLPSTCRSVATTEAASATVSGNNN